MPEYPKKERYDIFDLRRIMEILRSKDGCPWDRVQTHQSIRKDFIEETYEAVEAIDLSDPVLLREELGDVLLQVMFHSRIEEEEGRFSFDDVVHDICWKMLIRHPHVFANLTVSDTNEVLNNWEAIKNEVKGTASYTETLKLVPKVYPALMRSQKLQKRAVKVGVGEKSDEEALQTVMKAAQNLQQADERTRSCSLGKLLFACTDLARHHGIDAEEALTGVSEAFIEHFERMEKMAADRSEDLAALSQTERDLLWKKAQEI